MGQLLRQSTAADTVSSDHVPWLIIGICSVMCMVLLFSIRLLLAHENKRRDAEPPDHSYDDVYVMKIDDEGKRVEVNVSKVRVCFPCVYKAG